MSAGNTLWSTIAAAPGYVSTYWNVVSGWSRWNTTVWGSGVSIAPLFMVTVPSLAVSVMLPRR